MQTDHGMIRPPLSLERLAGLLAALRPLCDGFTPEELIAALRKITDEQLHDAARLGASKRGA